jgi:hypothetical protein
MSKEEPKGQGEDWKRIAWRGQREDREGGEDRARTE